MICFVRDDTPQRVAQCITSFYVARVYEVNLATMDIGKDSLAKIQGDFPLNLVMPGAKAIKKNTNSTQNKFQTHRAKQYEVTSFLSTDCELSTRHARKTFIVLAPYLDSNNPPPHTNIISHCFG